MSASTVYTYFEMRSISTGLPVSGLAGALSGSSKVQVSINGGPFPAQGLGTVVEVGTLGAYKYTWDTSEVGAEGTNLLVVNYDGGSTIAIEMDSQVTGTTVAVAEAAILAAVAAVPTAVMGFTLRSGRTVLGHLRRMDALYFGKIIGLLGLLVTAFQPGGSVAEFTATQDPATGSRTEVDCTTSETP